MWRYRAVGTYAVLLLLVTAAVGYRTFRPRDTLTSAERGYPAAVRATPRLYGALLSAPLVVDGRLRVYAAQREVWADAPIDNRFATSSTSPYWAYRRWPARLLGVAAVGRTVVSRWSDGYLVALDATRGTIAWRVRVPAVEGGYVGRRTGAATVYDPLGLYTAGSVVVAAGSGQARGYDAGTGRLLWTKPYCGTGFTGQRVFVSVCARESTVDVYDAVTGQALRWPAGLANLEPIGCAVGRSECRGVRTAGNAWVIGSDAGLTAAPALADPDSWLVDDLVVTPHADGSVTARAASGGRALWSWPSVGAAQSGARIVAVEPGAIHVLTADRDLVSIDPADGLELCRVPLINQFNSAFEPGYVYAADRFVFVERLLPGAKPSDPDSRYYYPSPGVLVTGS